MSKALKIPSELWEKAMAALRKNKIDEAIYFLEEYLSVNKFCIDGHTEIGNIFLSRGEYKKSIKHFKVALKYSHSVNSSYSLGLAYYKYSKYSKSIPYLENAFAQGGDEKMLTTLINAYDKSGQKELAIILSEKLNTHWTSTEFKKQYIALLAGDSDKFYAKREVLDILYRNKDDFNITALKLFPYLVEDFDYHTKYFEEFLNSFNRKKSTEKSRAIRIYAYNYLAILKSLNLIVSYSHSHGMAVLIRACFESIIKANYCQSSKGMRGIHEIKIDSLRRNISSDKRFMKLLKDNGTKDYMAEKNKEVQLLEKEEKSISKRYKKELKKPPSPRQLALQMDQNKLGFYSSVHDDLYVYSSKIIHNDGDNIKQAIMLSQHKSLSLFNNAFDYIIILNKMTYDYTKILFKSPEFSKASLSNYRKNISSLTLLIK